MGLRIQQLPAAIANQIAAGEVIERPASVVKELLENSFDAGADAITVEIGYGGLNQIKISDNGSGILAEDLPLAIAAHATSKITQLDDLYAIQSMGFRGEALASIASIARLTLSSKTTEQEHAMMLQVKGTELIISPCARGLGTTVDVVDLFYNAPVRKRFLKSEKLEFQAIEQVMKRFALSAPQIALTLKHNNKVIFTLPAALNEPSRQARMNKILGQTFVKESIFLDAQRGDMHLTGWISSPNFQRSQNDKQWVYINQRMVKDKLIYHAIKQAYQEVLLPGRFPSCLLYFSLNTAEVDVNVHPTKHEVRFQQPRLIHDFFTSEISKALAKEQNQDWSSTVSTKGVATKIHEPNTRTANDNDDVAKISLVRKPTPYKGNESSWVMLNNQYGLIFHQQQPYLVDVQSLQQQEFRYRLSTMEFPLKYRPLLVPVGYSISQEQWRQVEKELLHLGIQTEYADNKMTIRSVPIQIPYLDLSLFLDSLIQPHPLPREELLDLLCRCQTFDPKLLNSEERLQLQDFLFNTMHVEQPLHKALSADHCRMLLDA